jgi:DNA adenine methylase
MGLLEHFDDLDRHDDQKTRDVILRAPFGYPGGKSRSVEKLLTLIPYRKAYIEPFGGSAALMLARTPSPLEVFNDRYGGVVAFYRCLRHPKKYSELVRRLQLCVHSREEFVWCRDTWENVEDDVERAARWYYMTIYSFGSLGRNFGRSTRDRGQMAGKHIKAIEKFHDLHVRLSRVQVENQDWLDCIRDYDASGTVFYMDPPYIDVYPGTYKHEMSPEEHTKLLETIFSMRGFVALSAYDNDFYKNRGWDDVITWEVYTSTASQSYASGSKKEHLAGLEKRGKAKEALFIKEGR